MSLADKVQMRSLGYSVRPPADPTDCASWTMHPPHDSETVWLAKDEAEGWEKAAEHWHDKNIAASLASIRQSSPPAVEGEIAALVEDLQKPSSWHAVDNSGDKRTDGSPFRAASKLTTLSRQLTIAQGEAEAARAALKQIAEQKIPDEMSDEEYVNASYEDGYVGCVEAARTFLTPEGAADGE